MEQWLAGLLAWTSTNGGHLITGVISIVAAFGVGSLLSAWIASKSQRHIMLSQMRSSWINGLRDDLATFAGHAHKYDRATKELEATATAAKETERLYKLTDDLAEVRTQKNRLAHKVILQLNPFEDDHIKLAIIIRRMNSGESLVHRNKFRAQAQKVLKREWDVIKRGSMTEGAQGKWSDAWDTKLRDRRKRLKRLRRDVIGPVT